MTDKPIIFSAAMVRALLDGRKTQTRRIISPQPDFFLGHKTRYVPGDRLWMKEAHTFQGQSDGECLYRATVEEDTDYYAEEIAELRWRSPIFMPRWASRLTLTVTNVCVQRVQDISEEDALAEGIERLVGSKGPNHFSRQICGKWSGSFNAPTAQEVYADLWNTIHGLAAWERNDWVAAYTFTVQLGNIDGGKA